MRCRAVLGGVDKFRLVGRCSTIQPAVNNIEIAVTVRSMLHAHTLAERSFSETQIRTVRAGTETRDHRRRLELVTERRPDPGLRGGIGGGGGLPIITSP